MKLVLFALRRPVTVLVIVLAAALAGAAAIARMPRDIFPDLGVPIRNCRKPRWRGRRNCFAGKATTNQQIDEMRAKAQIGDAAAQVGHAKVAAAESDLVAAMANRAVAAAQAEVAAADARRLESMMDYTQIRAPFDGVVSRRWVNPGDLVQAATSRRTTLLFTCQKFDTVRVVCEVPESNALAVHVGDGADVQLSGAGGYAIHGKVTRFADSVDPQSRTMRTEIDLPNPDRKLLPGMYAQVSLTPSGAAGGGEHP